MNVLFACHCNSEYLTKNPLVREYRRLKVSLGLDVIDRHAPVEWRSEELIGDLHWVDPNPICPVDPQQFHSWSSLQNNHYDIIWSMYFSVYGYLTEPLDNISSNIDEYFSSGAWDPYDHVANFYHDVWTKLAKGGAFVVPINTKCSHYDVPLEEQYIRSQKMIQHLNKTSQFDSNESNWEVFLVPLHPKGTYLPFYVNMPTKDTHALVFCKV